VLPSRPTSLAGVLSKLALDQLLMAPLGSSAFLSTLALLDGGGAAEAAANVRRRLGPMMAANYTLWPAANAINFAFVPPEQRILYCSVVSVRFFGF